MVAEWSALRRTNSETRVSDPEVVDENFINLGHDVTIATGAILEATILGVWPSGGGADVSVT